jgi:hypothetical protein
MADNKKRLNITVKKSTPPFLFPESNLAVKDSVQYVNTEDGNSVRRMQTIVSTNFTNNQQVGVEKTNLVSDEEQPVKRKRGRPRLNKDANAATAAGSVAGSVGGPVAGSVAGSTGKVAGGVGTITTSTMGSATTNMLVATSTATNTDLMGTAVASTSSNNANQSKQKTSKSLFANLSGGVGKTDKTETGETEQTDSEALGTKKRGRKPKNVATSAVGVTVDRVYGLHNNSKNAMDLENLENLSYIVNLKITKDKVEQIIEELAAEAAYEVQKLNVTSVSPVVETCSSNATTQLDARGSVKPSESSNAITSLEIYEIGSNGDFSQVEYGNSVSRIQPAETNHSNFTVNNEVIDSGSTAVTECHGSTICSKCAGNMSNTVELSQIEFNINAEVGLMGQGYLDCYIGELMPGFIAKEETATGEHKRWPTTSKYPCRNCDETFTTVPAGLVQKIFGDFEVDPMRCKFFLYLNFCNWSCAARYAFDRMPDWVNQHNMMNLCYNMIKKKIDPKHLWRKVEMAPDLGNLARNGGELSIEQYRRAADTNIMYTLYIEPLIPLRMTLEETTINPRSTSNRAANKTASSKEKVVMLDKSRVMKAEQSIKSRKEGSRVNTIDRLMKVEVRS